MEFSEEAMQEAVRRATTVFDAMSPPENERNWTEICEGMLHAAAPVLVKDVMEAPRPYRHDQSLGVDDPVYGYVDVRPPPRRRRFFHIPLTLLACCAAVAVSIFAGGWVTFMVMTA